MSRRKLYGMRTRDVTPQKDARLALILSVERISLVARYVCLVFLVPMIPMGLLDGSLHDAIIISIVAVPHLLFSHWVFFRRRYELFRRPANLVLYLFEISLVVLFSSAGQSDAYVFYIFLLVGLSAYTQQFKRIIATAAVCCLAYTLVIVIHSMVQGLASAPGIIATKLLAIMIAGWLVGSLNALLAKTEQDALAKTQELANIEESIRTTLDSIPNPVVVYDENETIAYTNKSAHIFFGLESSALAGRHLRTFLFDDGSLSSRQALFHPQNKARSEEIVVNTEGEERTVELTTQPFQRDGQRFYVCVIYDITERKNLQEATRLANVHLKQLNLELRQADQLRTGFLVTISQKLRSPLNVILGYVDMLLDQELGRITAEQRQVLHTCRRNALRVFQLIDQTSDLGQPDAGRNRPSINTKPDPAPPTSQAGTVSGTGLKNQRA